MEHIAKNTLVKILVGFVMWEYALKMCNHVEKRVGIDHLMWKLVRSFLVYINQLLKMWLGKLLLRSVFTWRPIVGTAMSGD